MATCSLFKNTKMAAYDSNHILLKIDVHVVGIHFTISYRVVGNNISPRMVHLIQPWFMRLDSRDTDTLVYMGVLIDTSQKTKSHFLEIFFDGTLSFRIPVLCIVTAGPTVKEISKATIVAENDNGDDDKCHDGSLNTGNVVNQVKLLQALTVDLSKSKPTERRIVTVGQAWPMTYWIWDNVYRVCFPSKQTFQTLDVNLCKTQACEEEEGDCPLFSNAMIKHLMVMIECSAWEFYQAALPNEKFLKGLEMSDIQHCYVGKTMDPADLIEGMLQNGGPPLFVACMATPQCQKLTCDHNIYNRYLYQLVIAVRTTGTLKCWFSGHIKTCHYSMFYRTTAGEAADANQSTDENLLCLYNLKSSKPCAKIGRVEIPTREVVRILDTVRDYVVKLAMYFGYI